VLLNLVSNAIKFTEQGIVEVLVTEGKRDEKTAELIFTVRDSGIGITQEQLSGLFQTFSQADASTTRRFGGSGLGLALCKQLVEAMGGIISVDSTPDVGSVFRFKIPVALQSHPFPVIQHNVESTMQPRLTGVRVLLVEDNVINQIVAKELLNDVGVLVETVDNGSLACDKVLSCITQYDVILMDIQMPVMDGIDATRKIRESGFTLPIIAMTAHAMDEEKQRCLRVGMNDHISKPILPDVLYETLGKWAKKTL
jgi:CheY-like chemotaxis protein